MRAFQSQQLYSWILGAGMGLMTTATFAVPEAQWAEPNNLQVYMQQVIGQQGLGNSEQYRHYKNVIELNRVSAWIREQMRVFGIPCQFQNYVVNQQSYRNVVCKLNIGAAQKTIFGAHYDVYGQQQGANDNASGVAGVIETARILAQEKNKLSQNVEFVFYTLAEPPFFKTESMGSFIHAKSVQAEKEKIRAVYVLDMIGYYDKNLVQNYPIGLKWIYPSHGNFIAALSNMQSREMSATYCNAMQRLNQLQCERVVAPTFVKGMDFSDHLNYWKYDIPAILITDTGSYRGTLRHTTGDTLKTVNFEKMAHVVNGLVAQILSP
ncbi:M28 family peptidase [Acinetobacter sp. YH12120]|uniref:M28 family peptidase n=1 Tax=Acinetobacter sp. YH12120 TaxID=2601107 RepID=UPI0035A2D419